MWRWEYESKEEKIIYKRNIRIRSINKKKITRKRKQCNFYENIKYVVGIFSEEEIRESFFNE